ncbi:MAG: class II aldolase/adducin family protein [Pseudomonadota bacterium]
MAEAEGVIKFQLDHRAGESVAPASVRSLTAWRALLHRLGLVGQDPARYGGYGFGNVSVRVAAGFIISGTQTGAPEWLPIEGWAHVTVVDLSANAVRSEGPVRPSSEALTHAACYALEPTIAAVLHVHCPELWAAAETLGLAETPADVAYGTPAMATAVRTAHVQAALGDRGLIAMGGHEHGIVSFGPSVAIAGSLLVEALARALEQSVD